VARLLAIAAVAVLVAGGVTLVALEGGEVVVLRTQDAAGTPRDTRTWVADDADGTWIEAANPTRPFLAQLTERPDVHWCSAVTGEGVPELLQAIGAAVAAAPAPPAIEVTPPVERLRQRGAPAAAPAVERHAWGFLVTGAAVERLVSRARFDSEAATQRFQVALDRMGVSAALEEAGAEPGDIVRIGEMEFEYQP